MHPRATSWIGSKLKPTRPQPENFILEQLEGLTSNAVDDPFEVFNLKKVDLLECAIQSGNYVKTNRTIWSGHQSYKS
ncbi:hypothetical protein EMCRGX_G000801 [Ephydatia muelleri]